MKERRNRRREKRKGKEVGKERKWKKFSTGNTPKYATDYSVEKPTLMSIL